VRVADGGEPVRDDDPRGRQGPGEARELHRAEPRRSPAQRLGVAARLVHAATGFRRFTPRALGLGVEAEPGANLRPVHHCHGAPGFQGVAGTSEEAVEAGIRVGHDVAAARRQQDSAPLHLDRHIHQAGADRGADGQRQRCAADQPGVGTHEAERFVIAVGGCGLRHRFAAERRGGWSAHGEGPRMGQGMRDFQQTPGRIAGRWMSRRSASDAWPAPVPAVLPYRAASAATRISRRKFPLQRSPISRAP
jgi:hypothetical protein